MHGSPADPSLRGKRKFPQPRALSPTRVMQASRRPCCAQPCNKTGGPRGGGPSHSGAKFTNQILTAACVKALPGLTCEMPVPSCTGVRGQSKGCRGLRLPLAPFSSRPWLRILSSVSCHTPPGPVTVMSPPTQNSLGAHGETPARQSHCDISGDWGPCRVQSRSKASAPRAGAVLQRPLEDVAALCKLIRHFREGSSGAECGRSDAWSL